MNLPELVANHDGSLIRTKLRLPFTRPELVPRPGSERSARLTQTLTLIAAPAGFGKTTLIASSVAEWGCPIAWLSLDKDDNRVTFPHLCDRSPASHR